MMIDDKNFKDIKTCFCFLDETGLIHQNKDRFFAIGIIKCSNPQKLYNRIRRIRDKYNYREELKWTRLDRKIRFDIAREFFNIFLTEKANFNCIILNKEELDFKKHFNNDLCKVYRNFTIALLKMIIKKEPKEILILLTDDYFTSDDKNLEESIKGIINDHYKKFVVAGVCQIDSKSSDLLQLTDIILGSILYDLKKQNKLVVKQNRYKRRFLNFEYQKLNIRKSFFENKKGFKTRNHKLSNDKIMVSVFDSKKSVSVRKNKNKP